MDLPRSYRPAVSLLVALAAVVATTWGVWAAVRAEAKEQASAEARAAAGAVQSDLNQHKAAESVRDEHTEQRLHRMEGKIDQLLERVPRRSRRED